MHRTADEKCSYCGHRLDAATNAGDGNQPPRPGDISICIQCSTVTVFDDDLKHRTPTEADIAEMLADPALSVQIAVTANAVRWVYSTRN